MIDDTSRIIRSRRATEADFRRWSKRLPVNAEYDELRGVELPPLLLGPEEAVVGPMVTVPHPGADIHPAYLPHNEREAALVDDDVWEGVSLTDVLPGRVVLRGLALWLLACVAGWCAWIGWCEVLR